MESQTPHSLPPSSPLPLPALDVVAGLIFRDGKLLITQRPPQSHLGGLWEFPGGKCEPGESDEQALIRELREELGVDVEVGALLESVTHQYPTKRVCIRFHRCTVRAGNPAPLGCHALRWVNAAELADHEFPAADATLLDRIRSDASLWR